MMKTRTMGCITLGWLHACMALAAVPIPPETHGKLEALVRRLDAAVKPGDYLPEDYFRDLAELGRSVSPALATELAKSEAGTFDGAMLLLASAATSADQEVKIKELGVWYGQPQSKVPRELRPKMSDEQWARLRSHFSSQHVPRAEPLRAEHAVADYRTAWEAWMISPPSSELGYLTPNLLNAMAGIHDARSRPLLTRAFKWAAAREGDDRSKRSAAMSYIHLIGESPGEEALDALLECNRHAIEKGFNGTGLESVSRAIIRVLASRVLLADQMEDPEMLAFLQAQGSKILKPEEIPPPEDLWKTYKPVIAKRLANKELHLPVEDAAILRSAMAIMPKE